MSPDLDRKETTMDHSPVIRKLRFVDIPKAVRMIVAAMENDPTIHYFRDTSDAKADYWQKKWKYNMAIILANAIRKDEAWTVGDVYACLVFEPADQTEDILDKLVYGMLRIFNRTVAPQLYSRQQKRRGAEWKVKSEEAIRVTLGGRKRSMWYLAELATHPDHQGHGFGSALVRSFTERVDKHGGLSWLMSSNIENTAFYNSLGFITKAEIPLGDSDPDWHGPPVVNSLMIRDVSEKETLV
ncbi:hypothetical protein BDY19DRAFT_340915 [Irpex rosettiformis]|uniref:Uncharacterized protein n=1 Tax=Irpex rosettiformis TaxID=378272 RepID=A0ACB8TX60_9APHY|nr:hypothetical protein BDY19DRAFT_340915 [Irpex rosettiformis]